MYESYCQAYRVNNIGRKKRAHTGSRCRSSHSNISADKKTKQISHYRFIILTLLKLELYKTIKKCRNYGRDIHQKMLHFEMLSVAYENHKNKNNINIKGSK